MPTSQVNEVIQYLRRTVLLPDRAAMTDGQLLSRFLEGRDEDAFAALVKRHAPMVWGVCRRLLGNHQDAEDAFQATFLVLVRKATTVLPREMVANWLYGVAYMTAHRAKVAAAKARRRERQFVNMPEPAVAEPDLWNDLRPLLDQELTRLPDLYRVVVVLCDLEGKTRKEAARQLGLPEGTVTSRLARARAMLAKRLARHGLGVSGAALAAVLSQKAASASVPSSVVSSTIKAASLFAAGQAAVGINSAKVAALTEGVMKAMFLTKLKGMMAVKLAVVAMVGIGAGMLGYGAAAGEPNEGKNAAAVARQREVATSDEEGPCQKDAAEKDKETLQGRWVAVSAEAGGRPVPEEKVQKAHVTLLVSRNEFTATASGAFTNEVGMKGDATWRGTIKIDPSQQPGWFDLVDCRLDAGKAKEVKTSGTKGIYELKGDTLTVCYGPERPTEFKTKPYSYMKLYVFQREKKAKGMPKEQPATKETASTPKGTGGSDTPKKDTAKSDPEKIQGAWRLVRVEVNGVEVTPFLPPPGGFRATFTGDKWTSDFMEGKGFTFQLDPGRKPKAIDLHPLEDADKTLLGIYQLKDDDLTICFCQRGKRERPSVFENYWKAGSHTVLVVLKRPAGKVDQPPKDEEEVRQLLHELLQNEKVRQLLAEHQQEADREKAMRQFFDEIRNNPALLDGLLKGQSEQDRKELR